MIIGLLVAIGLYFGRLAEFNFYKQTGIHEGVWGLLANLIVVIGYCSLKHRHEKH